MGAVLMDVSRKKLSWLLLISFTLLCCQSVNGTKTKYTVEGNEFVDKLEPHIVLQDHERYRRASPEEISTNNTNLSPTNTSITPITIASSLPSTPNLNTSTPNITTTTVLPNSTILTKVTDQEKEDKNSTNATATVMTKTHLLGENCSGIYHGNTSNYSINGNLTSVNGSIVCNNTPKVSEPISPDDNYSAVFTETPETIMAEQNLTNLNYDNHTFYQSVFIGNLTFFNEHWDNITKSKEEIHPILSNSHRRATTLKLSFDFPFYGTLLKEVTVATGGFIYTGDHVHHWLAATQYIAPLMANFDTSIGNNSFVKLFDDGEKFTALWENVSLQEENNKTFTFAVTLYKNGDIVFAYKQIPVAIKDINDLKHPVKVGISDAYLTDKIMFYVRRKTIYEYHRVNFKNHEITNGTILKLIAQPTCLQYNSCNDCLHHETDFNCVWCEQLQKCSSGTDRAKQDWLLRNCDKVHVTNASACPALQSRGPDDSPTYDTGNPNKDISTIIKINHDQDTNTKNGPSETITAKKLSLDSPEKKPTVGHSSVGGFVAAFVVIVTISALLAWVFYAFKHPHTRSGQWLIKYRPSQWSWRRGEARYTAATIHM